MGQNICKATNKVLLCKIYKQLLQLNIKKQTRIKKLKKIRRHLLLGRKTMTNLDSVLKSRDITLSTKVCLVKAMVFPVIMYRCESWTIMKTEC